MHSRALTLSLLAAVATAPAVGAQIRPNTGIRTQSRANLPLVVVATPYTVNAQDSALAVEAGVGLRARLQRNHGNDYAFATRERMNEALNTWGYPADALLDHLAARMLAVRTSSRFLVFPTLQRTQAGGHRLNARFIIVGPSYGAGHVVSVEREAGEDPEDLGQRAADQLRPTFRALESAVECYNLAPTDPNKAIAAANKAIGTVPNFGAAEYCLAQIAQARDSVSMEAVAHYENAIKSDPQSMPSYAAMGRIFHRRNDTSRVVSIYQTMLEVDPLDQELREDAFTLFQAYGRPTAAEEVADAGIRRDPQNTDWYDLKSNACLVQEKYRCAIDELERLWTIDSTRADTSFFTKITYAAGVGGDTTALLRWAEKGVERYPQNGALLTELNRAYAMAGNLEGTVRTARELVAIEPTRMDPAIRAMQMLIEAGRVDEALAFTAVIKASDDFEAKNNYGALLIPQIQGRLSGDTARQIPRDLPKAIALADSVLGIGGDNEQVNTYANYFMGLGALILIGELDAQAVEQRSCSLVQQIETLLPKAVAGLPAGLTVQPQQAPNYIKTANEYSPRVQALRQAYCS
jgi:tetratricopeptide (TPR) repeat protein